MTVEVRGARATDRARLLQWRNDPVTRAHAFTTEAITEDEHATWFSRKLADPMTHIWIGESDGVAIGQVRFDRGSGGIALVDIAVAPEARGAGLGRQLLAAGMSAEHQRSAVGVFRAEVGRENAASRALFTSAGFTAVRESAARLTYERRAAD